MSRRDPGVYLFGEGGGLVTRCHDVRQARALLAAAWLRREEEQWSHAVTLTREDVAAASRAFRAARATVGYGRVIPVATHQRAAIGCHWWWQPVDGPGPRVTAAVWWSE